MTKILSGLPLAKDIKEDIRSIVEHIQGRKPCLVTVLTTQNPASKLYVSRKLQACEQVGIQGRLVEVFPESTEELLATIDSLNNDPGVDGILVQMPLPPHIDNMRVLEHINPKKDVDGFHPVNIGKAFLHDPNAFYPCTPLGIQRLLAYYEIPISGRHVVIVGRSNIVGKPLALLLLENSPSANATVTIAHSKTKDLKTITLSADILITAIGKPKFITADMIREGAVVIDVGSNIIESKTAPKQVVGDVDFEHVCNKVFAISPVPNGVGPLTIAMLLQNTIKSFLLRTKL